MIVTAPNILVMDDEGSIRYDYRNVLTRGHLFSVRLAKNAGHAKRVIETERVNAAIVDIRMTKAGSEGLGIIELIRQQHPYAYIEVVTGFHEFVDAASEKGADRVFIKPILLPAMRNTVERVWEGILLKQVHKIAQTADLDSGKLVEFVRFQVDEGRRPDWRRLWEELDLVQEKLQDIHVVIDTQLTDLDLPPFTANELHRRLSARIISSTIDKFSLQWDNSRNGGGNNMSKEEQANGVDHSMDKIAEALVKNDWNGCTTILMLAENPQVSNAQLESLYREEKIPTSRLSPVLSTLSHAGLITTDDDQIALTDIGMQTATKLLTLLPS